MVLSAERATVIMDEPHDPRFAALLAENVILVQLLIEIAEALRDDPKYQHLCVRLDAYHQGTMTPC